MRDIIRPVPVPAPDALPPAAGRALLWFAALSLGGVGLTAAVAYGLHALLRLG